MNAVELADGRREIGLERDSKIPQPIDNLDITERERAHIPVCFTNFPDMLFNAQPID